MATMQKRRPEEIIGEWGVRDVTPPSARERERLEADRELNPLTGKPLRRRLRNFRAEADNYLASLGGPLPYMQRLREIELATERHLARLAEAHAELRDDAEAWRRLAERWDFGEINELIDRHNRYYPSGAPWGRAPRPGDFVRAGGNPSRREPLDARWTLARFPA